VAVIVVLAVAALTLLPSEWAAAAPGDILVVDPGPPGGARVVRVDPDDGTRTLVSANNAPAGGPSLVQPAGIAVDPDGDIVVVDSYAFTGGGVIRVDPVSGARTAVSANGMPTGGPDFFSPTALAIEADGDIVASDGNASAGGTGLVIRIDPDSGARTTVSANGMPAGAPDFASPFGIAVEADGDIVVIDQDAFAGEAGLIRVDPGSGVRSTASSNAAPGPYFVDPGWGIAVEADGQMVVTDSVEGTPPGGVFRVDPVSGRRTVLSANGAPAGGPDFVSPNGLAIEADGDILVVDDGVEVGDGKVIRVDPTSGARTLVSANGTPAGGPDLGMPLALTVVPPADCPAGGRDWDRDGTPNGCDRDDDNDRLSDRAERLLGTSSSDLDSDDDGLGDGREDRNHNGRKGKRETDPPRFDSDRDGLSDGLELGVRRPVADPPGPVAGSGRRFRRDLHPSTRTRPLRPDTDGGGIRDGEEDPNHNGRRDPGEHNPNKAGR
jgi:large repetitive protein